MKQESPHTRFWNDEVTNPLLFPDDSATFPEALPLTNPSSIPESSPPPNTPPSLAQITAEWQMLLKRLGRRRRVLEAVLAAGHPLKLTGLTLVVGFSPQRRFHQELPDMPDYRSCVEEELARTFQAQLSVVTALYPDSRRLPRQGTFSNTPA
jgi:hypothetical protein